MAEVGPEDVVEPVVSCLQAPTAPSADQVDAAADDGVGQIQRQAVSCCRGGRR
jgi:hypothetical protein